MIRIGVLGAAGRMGRLVCRAVADDPDLALVAGIGPGSADTELGPLIGHGDVDVRISGDLDALLHAEAEVAVDFTTPQTVMGNIRWLVEHGIHAVVGTTGIGPKDLEEIRSLAEGGGGERGGGVELRHRGGPAAALRRTGRPRLPGRRDHRAAPRDEARRALRDGHRHRAPDGGVAA